MFLKHGRRQPFWMSKITFDRISYHFRSMRNFFFQMFDQMAAGGHLDIRKKITFDHISGHFKSIGHFGCPKFTFDRISGDFRSIGYFGCPKNFSIVFLDISNRYGTFYSFNVYILDVRKSLSNACLAISDRYGTFIFYF